MEIKSEKKKIKKITKNIKMNNKSPLRYPGGKTRACKILYEIILNHFNLNNIENLVSPFFGGGSFEFFMQNNRNINLICNDKFKPLYIFWNQCKKNNKNLCDLLKGKLNSIEKKNFYDFRENIMKENDHLMIAYYYFIINRCSFSGATLSGGFSKEASKKRFTLSSIEKIEKLNLDKFKIFNLDFSRFLEKTKEYENSIIFLDPPYYLEKSNLYGEKGDLHENFDHDKLFNIIKNYNNWIMTYNNCDFIKNLYKNFKIIETKWTYGMNKTKKSSEIIIINN